MPLRSSLPESAFIDILSVLEPLPEFPRLLATANEQGQTLLHLAIHLRYRDLVQKLIHWGVDPNVRDVNGFTALHAGYLCDDPFVVGFLEAEGATPFVLDELGRSPTELAGPFSSATGVTTTGKDEGMVPLAVGYTNRSKGPERCRLPDRAIPAETQETTFGLSAETDPPSSSSQAIVNALFLFHKVSCLTSVWIGWHTVICVCLPDYLSSNSVHLLVCLYWFVYLYLLVYLFFPHCFSLFNRGKLMVSSLLTRI